LNLRRAAAGLFACAIGLVIAGGSVASTPGHLVISQVYGGGGNTGAPYTHDYVELYNPTSSPISLSGLSIQYASATGTGNFGASTTQLTELTGTVPARSYFLVQQAAGAGNGVALPAPDQVDATPIAMSGTDGKVALVTGTSSLGCNGGSTACSTEQRSRIVDLVGYGSANYFEGSGAAPRLSNTTAAFRADGGRVDTDDNAADFTAAAPDPRNSSVTTGTPRLVVSQVYGGGGNTGAPYTHDFVELFNAGTAPMSLEGLSIQYASATGTGNFGASSTQLTELPAVTLAPGRYFLVQQAGGATGAALPAPDHTDPTPINLSGSAGKVALVTGTTSLGCNGGSTACSAEALARIVDLVGYGGANFYEGTGAAPGLTNATAAARKQQGCQDTDNNAADFTAEAPAPRTTATSAHVCDTPPDDLPPTVAGTVPASGATNVPAGSDVTITFSEPVSVSGDWFSIACTASGSRTATVAGGPETYTLDISGSFSSGETCTVTIRAANVIDRDGTPQNMTADYSFTFQVAEVFACGNPVTRIHAIQGSGMASPMVGSGVSVEAVVVGSYQGTNQFNGFYLQEKDANVDGDPATSEGIFVFAPGQQQVAKGDVVRVRGTVAEFNGLTQVSNVNALEVCATGASVTAAQVSLPAPSVEHLERYEGMLVELRQNLTVTEVYTLGRFGEVSLSGAGRLYIPTAVAEPGAPAAAVAAQNARSRIVLDDGFSNQNPDPVIYPQGGLSATNTLRVGDSLPTGVTGVMDYRFSLYRLQPVGAVHFSHTNPRQAAPDPVGGNLKLASFNVLNYFNGDGLGGGFPTSRGARNTFEFERQRTKIIAALKAMDADVVGLMEMENDAGPNSAIADLVRGLNDAMGAGTYAYVDTGVIGTDEIKVAAIYKPATVRPAGDWKILTAAIDPRFDTNRNRPALAQTFQHLGSGDKLTVVVNHLKSKGSGCGAGDDATDGSGNCDGTRTRAAAALVDWMKTDPTGSGSPDVLIMGDLNAYTFERPITTIEAGGYVNLVREYGGLGAYSYVFNGESGYLDHALATESLAAKVSGVTDWHINPDEPVVLEYGTQFKSNDQIASFYDPGPFRSSDHDPVLIGIRMANTAPTATLVAPATASAGMPFTLALTNASDTSPVDTAAGFEYAFDCGGGYGGWGSASSATCTSTTLGALPVGAKIRDRQGAESEYRASVQIGVSYTSLGALTRQYVTNAGIAESLVAKLEAAAAAAERGNDNAKNGQLGAYRNELEAQAGKSITAERARTLIRLASAL